MEGNAPPPGIAPGPTATCCTPRPTAGGARDDEETTSMAEHGRGAGGRHAAPGEARALSGTAVSSVLLYRLATYWLPIPFGWLSLSRLQKVGAI